MLYVLGNNSRFCSLVLMNMAILCDGACVLLTTGLMDMDSLCVFTYAFNLGAFGCMLVRYLCAFCSLVICTVELPSVSVFGIYLWIPLSTAVCYYPVKNVLLSHVKGFCLLLPRPCFCLLLSL